MQRDECQAKLHRASILMNSLGNEKSRWIKTSERLLREKQSLLGDMIMSTAFITYLGPFEGAYRERIALGDWRLLVREAGGVLVSDSFNLRESLGSVGLIQQWQIRGLPQDNVSVENMIIMEESRDKWSLIIDPQGQALKFLKDFMADQPLVVVKTQQENYSRRLEVAMTQGLTVICENMTENVEPPIKAVINRELSEIQGDKYIRFNDEQVEFSEKFRFFMVSNQSNPHFSPEVQTKTRILNFSVTKEGLEQQLLSIVCKSESQRDEDERDKIQRQNVEFKQQKRQIEDQILQQLSQSELDILEDDTLVNSLNESKKITDDIKTKLKSAKIVQERINENRKNYKPVAAHGATLYFCV